MTTVQGAFKNGSNRYYWSKKVANEPQVIEVLEEELANNELSVSIALQAGLIKPSLTTMIKSSSVLTRSAPISEEEREVVKAYNSLCLAYGKNAPVLEQAKSESAMTLGSAVHLFAELFTRLGREDAISAVFEEFRLSQHDHDLFYGYIKSLEPLLEEVIYAPEVPIETSKWKGTADAVTEFSVIDWKTGRNYFSKNFLQVIALASGSGRKEAELIVPSSNGLEPVRYSVPDEIFSLGEQVVSIAEKVFHEKQSFAKPIVGVNGLEIDSDADAVMANIVCFGWGLKNGVCVQGKKRAVKVSSVPARRLKESALTAPPF